MTSPRDEDMPATPEEAGEAMWHAMQKSFLGIAQLYGPPEQRALAWATFLSAAAGVMCQDVGVRHAQIITMGLQIGLRDIEAEQNMVRH